MIEDETKFDEQTKQVDSSAIHKKSVLQNLFRKESHYMWTLAFLVSAHVLYMKYLFPRDWADTPAALALIDRMASIVPALRVLQQDVLSYTHYWGVFYATFWIMIPIYFVLGFISPFYFSAERYKKVVVKMGVGRTWALLLVAILCVLLAFAFPLLSFGPLVNQMSDFLPKLILSWFMTAGMFNFLANVIAILILKFKLNQNH